MRHHSKKNGQVTGDMLLVIVILFMFVIISIMAFKVFAGINASIQSDPTFDTEAKTTLNNAYNKFPAWVDGLFVLCIGLFWVALIISTFYIRTHPIFFIVSVLLITITFVVGMILSNAYEDLSSNTELSTYTQALPSTNWIMGHFLEVLIGMGVTMLIALYAKRA